MANVSVYNMEGKETGTLELKDSVFAVPVNEHLIHKAVVAQLANKRQGTQKAKTRSEVRGGGRKPWRQKGTGHARQGSIRAPQWKGGGVVFAPVPRDYSVKMNKKEKAAALKSVLSAKVSESKLKVLDALTISEIKTKTVVNVLDALEAQNALIVVEGVNFNVAKNEELTEEQAQESAKLREEYEKVQASGRNIPGVRVVDSCSLNVYDLMKYDNVVVTEAAVKKIEEVYA